MYGDDDLEWRENGLVDGAVTVRHTYTPVSLSQVKHTCKIRHAARVEDPAASQFLSPQD